MKLKMVLKSRSFFVFQICIFLVGLLAFSLGSAYADREEPGPKLGEPKVILETEQTNPNMIPYVAPQPNNDGPQEASGSGHLITPSSLVNDQDPMGKGRFAAMAGLSWGKDIHASRISWPPSANRKQTSLATHGNNRLYIAYLAHVGDSSSEETYIEVNYSEDAGLTWKSQGWIWKTNIDLSDPSIAVTNDTVVVAYVVHPTTGDPYVEVATASLTGNTWTAHSILHFATVYERRPQIWTDYNVYSSSSSVYLTYEWVVDLPSNNINIGFQRSGTDGATWINRIALIGNTNLDEYLSPSGCFGESNYHRLYVVCYDKTTKTLVLRQSSDWGMTWGSEQNLYTLTYVPNSGSDKVHPSIAAATTAGRDEVIVAFCRGADAVSDDDVRYLISYDNGVSWAGAYAIPGVSTTSAELSPFVIASPKGSYFHLVYTTYAVNNPIYYTKRLCSTSNWISPQQVNRGGIPSISYHERGIVASFNFDFPSVVWTDYGYDTSNFWYNPRFNRLVPDDLVGTWAGDGTYYRSDINNWFKLGTPATQVAAGDLDNDQTADIAGVWPSQAGVWVYKSSNKSWVLLGSTPVDISCGDMDGNGTEDFVATWAGQGVYYKTSISGSWVLMATPADLITVGDLDGDGTDDIVGIWPSQGGVWVKYSATGTWTKLGSTAVHIATGDMNGDGRDDLVGTWDGQGVYYRNSIGGAWVHMATPATLIASGDLDGDGTDDLIGIWPAQAGVWVKYSSTGAWKYISSTATDISAGKMRGGANTWGASTASLAQPAGGVEMAGPLDGPYMDLSRTGPGGSDFIFKSEANLVPPGHGEHGLLQLSNPGPGMIGFQYSEEENLEPRLDEKPEGGPDQKQR